MIDRLLAVSDAGRNAAPLCHRLQLEITGKVATRKSLNRSPRSGLAFLEGWPTGGGFLGADDGARNVCAVRFSTAHLMKDCLKPSDEGLASSMGAGGRAAQDESNAFV